MTPNSPGHRLSGGNINDFTVNTTNSIGLKGYYDGLIDIPVISSTTSSTRPVGITPSKSPNKKPVYAWTLPEFGTENEPKVADKYS